MILPLPIQLSMFHTLLCFPLTSSYPCFIYTLFSSPPFQLSLPLLLFHTLFSSPPFQLSLPLPMCHTLFSIGPVSNSSSLSVISPGWSLPRVLPLNVPRSGMYFYNMVPLFLQLNRLQFQEYWCLDRSVNTCVYNLIHLLLFVNDNI